MELSHQLAEQLILLEQQAAQCAALLDGASPEVLAEVIAAFAPLPALKITSAKQRETWRRTWLAWIVDCGQRWESRPSEPSADDLHLVIVGWAAR